GSTAWPAGQPGRRRDPDRDGHPAAHRSLGSLDERAASAVRRRRNRIRPVTTTEPTRAKPAGTKPTRTKPPSNPVGLARRAGRLLWRRLTSMRTAIVLLFLLALAAVPGSLLPQRPLNPAKV